MKEIDSPIKKPLLPKPDTEATSVELDELDLDLDNPNEDRNYM